MAKEQKRTLDFLNQSRIVNLPSAAANGQPVIFEQLNAAVEGISWKTSCRVSTQANLNLAAPGATIDGITMASGDRFIARSQTAGAENGIYIWNGAATPATRSLDMNSATEVEQATTTVEEGTNAGVTYRQTVVNVTLGTTALAWTTFGTSAGAASTAVAGIVQLATQTETNTGTDALKALTPATLSGSVYASKKFSATVGDGTATSYTITHNLNTRDVTVVLYRATGNFDEVDVEVQHTTVNTVTLLFDVAPAAAQFNVFIAT